MIWRIALPGSPADRYHRHWSWFADLMDVHPDDRSTRGGGELEVAPALDWATLEQLERGGRGYREMPMRRADRPASERHGPAGNGAGRQPAERGGGADEVDNGVDCADFVEGDRVYRDSVQP